MKYTFPFFSRTGRARVAKGFSLVEITLALGIVSFALVGIIGVLPTALNSSRQSLDKSRAVIVADTLFASFHSQPFQTVGYLDSQFNPDGSLMSSSGTIDLNIWNTPVGSTTYETICYATFLDASTSTSATDYGTSRRLRFASTPSGGADYLVKMHFNNQPDGMAIQPVPGTPNGQPTVPAQANRVELIISATGRPKDQYHFVTTVANRTN